MRTMEQLSRPEQVLISTIAACEELIDKGLMTGPKLLSEEGRAIVAELKASKFKPTAEETRLAMQTIQSQLAKGLSAK